MLFAWELRVEMQQCSMTDSICCCEAVETPIRESTASLERTLDYCKKKSIYLRDCWKTMLDRCSYCDKYLTVTSYQAIGKKSASASHGKRLETLQKNKENVPLGRAQQHFAGNIVKDAVDAMLLIHIPLVTHYQALKS